MSTQENRNPNRHRSDSERLHDSAARQHFVTFSGSAGSRASVLRGLVALTPLLLLGACATVPAPLQGNYTVVEPNQVAASGRVGDQVRWGGVIIETQPQSERTCLEVLSRDLGDTARPRQRDSSHGRFIACRAGFYDPELFQYGREVTVTGRVSNLSERTVGEYVYVMPEVAADVIYLWPERRPDEMYVRTYPGPWWGPWPYHHGWHGTWYVRPAPRPRPRPRSE